MAQYIDKDALVAEIKRRRKLVSDPILSGNDLMIGERNALFDLLSFIDTLEVNDVNLDEHQIADIIQNLFPTNQFIESETLLLDKEEVIIFAKHFFNLGIKIQKEG